MANSPISRERMPEVNMPAVLNRTASSLAIGVTHSRRERTALCQNPGFRHILLALYVLFQAPELR